MYVKLICYLVFTLQAMAENVFSRVKWLEEGNRMCEQAIPDSWCVGDTVRWPAVQDARKYIMNCKAPARDWRSFKLVEKRLTGESCVSE
jgi:hypothetical protein